MKKICLAFLAVLICVQAVPINEKTNSKDVKPKYRLPNTTSPIHYTLSIIVGKDSFSTNKYEGAVIISINATESTDEIVLHSSNFTQIKTVKLERNVIPHTAVSLEKPTFDGITEILSLKLKDGQKLDKNALYTLTITFINDLRTDAMYGFYKSSYEEDGKTKYLATTQFEATYARTAFPCYDEPIFKATFDVSINHPLNYNALFNTKLADQFIEDDSVRNVFTTTPVMSTYLLAFIVSEFTNTTSEALIDNAYPHKVWSKNSSAESREVAVDLGPKMLAVLEKFTNIDFKEHKLQKMDQVAIPDFSAGAMENWGLVTYREADLLFDNDSTVNYYQRVATVIAHEFTHQWFGDIVTLNWWSETWLNEGFATYFEYHAAAEVLTDFELQYQFVPKEVQTALASDARKEVQPMSDKDEDVQTPAQVAGKFGTISYNKGGSVLRMLRHIVGDENFRKGLQSYLAAHKFNNTRGTDVWAAFDELNVANIPYKVSDIMKNWTVKSGFPVLHVSLSGNTVSFSQNRYLLNETDSDNTTWYIPISYTDSKSKDFDNTQPKVWLTPDQKTVSIKLNNDSLDWFIVNLQQAGYYRVNYDDEAWHKIYTTLSKKASDIHVLNRAQLVDDALNLARVGKVRYERAFQVISYLKNEKDYIPWLSVFSAYNFLLIRTRQTKLGDALSGNLLDLIQNIFKSVPMNDTKQDTKYYLTQELIWQWACKLGHEDCVKQSSQLFSAQRSGTKEVHVSLRSAVYCTALSKSKNSEDWNYLWNRYLKTNSSCEKRTILSALGCTTNATLLNDYLHKSITENSGIRKQDATSVFSSVVSGNEKGVDTAIDFVSANIKNILIYYKSMNALDNLFSAIGTQLSTEEQIKRFETFVNKAGLEPEVKKSANAALTSMKSNQQWTMKYSKQLLDLFGLGNAASAITYSTFLVVVPVLFMFTNLFLEFQI